MITEQLRIRGSKSGAKKDLEEHYSLMKSGGLNPPLNLISQADVPGALEHLRKGGVAGRLIAQY